MTSRKKPWYRKPWVATLFHASLFAHLMTAVVWNLTNPRPTRRGMKTAFFASAMSVWEIGSVLKNWRGWRRRRALKLRLVTGAANSDVEMKIARRV
jgi:hypothetical protein